MRSEIQVFGVVLAVLASGLVGCGASPRRGGMGGPGGGAGGGSTGQGTGGTQGTGGGAPTDPQAALNALAQFVGQRGYAPAGPAVHGNLPPNGIIAYAINATPGTCYVVAALGGGSADINLYVLDATGGTVGYDVRPDAHPWAAFCATAGGRYIARVQMTQGVGDYYYIAFQAPATSGQADLASFFGGSSGVQRQAAQIDPATAQRLERVSQTLAGERFAPLGEPMGELFAQGETRDFQLNLQQGVCYAFATFGGPGVRDTDVFLSDGQGNTLESDTGTAVDAQIRYCPPRAGAYTLRARMYGGNGPLFTAGWSQGAAAGTQQQVIAQTSTASAGLDENFRLIDGDMRARGYEAMGTPERSELAESATRDFELTLEGEKCYAILAVGDTTVRDLDLTLLDASGRTIDRDVQTDARPVVRVCPDRSGTFRMQVRMYAGSGNFVYQPYRWPRGTRGPFGLRGLMFVRLSEMVQLQSVEGFTQDDNFSIERATLRREHEQRTHDVALAAGQCYSIIVVGGAGVNDLDVTLTQGSTRVDRDGTRNPFPSVRVCTQAAARYRLTVEAAGGAGEYAFQVFRRTGT